MEREGYKPPTLEDLKPKVPHVDIPDDDVADATQSLAESEKELGMKLEIPNTGGERHFWEWTIFWDTNDISIDKKLFKLMLKT